MTARRWLYLVLLLLGLGLAGGGYLFWLQNSQQMVTVSFEFWGLGRHGREWSAPELIALSGGIGFALGLGLMIPGRYRKSQEVKRLQQKVAMSGSDSSNNSTWR